MPRLIFKCPYIKGGTSAACSHLENYVQYMATRSGVDRIDPGRNGWPATINQKEMIEQILRDFPLSRGMFEYEDYRATPTRSNAFVLKWRRKPLPVHGWNLQSPVQKCRSNIVQMNFVDSKKRKKLCWKPHKPWHRTKTAKRRTGLNPFLLFIAAACGTVDKFRLFVFSSQAGLPLPAVRTLLRQFRCVKQIVAVVTRANQINHLDMFSL